MDKQSFAQTYHPLLTIWFYWDKFLADKKIKVTRQSVQFKDVQDFYVLRTVKKGALDPRGIEQRVGDPGCQLITLQKAREDPLTWDLGMGDRVFPKFDELWPIPIATDSASGLSLILDSNHLLANLACEPKTRIPLIILSGPNLEKLVEDFKILNA